MEWKANPEFLGKILPLALKRLETLSDFFPLAQFLLTDTPDYSTEELVGKLEAANVAKILKIAEWEMEKLPQWNRDQLSNLFQQISEVEDLKLKQVLPPFFVAISGNSVSLPLFDSLTLLGPDLTRTRLRSALEKLSSAGSGLSKKGLKKLEKEYVQKYGNRID
jgi:glutamyl-tRNA synthetase